MNRAFTHHPWKSAACTALLFLQSWSGTAASGPSGNAGSSGSAKTAVTERQTMGTAGRPDWGRVDWDEWESVEDLLNDIREVSGIPAIAAVIVRDGNIIDFATVGVREFGTSETVGSDDRFHLGSVTKSMTATVIGKLVETGVLTWGTTVASVLPDIAMRKEYRDVTIEQLLHHQGGIASYTTSRSYRDISMKHYSGTPTEQRGAFLARILELEPTGIPGQVTLYSNAGYALAGYMAERVTGKSWEDLIERHIFAPLEMTTAGFGHPGTASIPDQPRGHGTAETGFVPLSDDQHPPMDIIAPAGNVHSSIRDLARYAMSHLAGLNGDDAYLRSETIQRLHTLPRQVGEMNYAAGWMVGTDQNGKTVHYHGGTTGSFYAELKLFPERRTAVAVLMNVGQTTGELVANKVGRSLMARYGPRAQPVAVAKQSKTGAPQFRVERPRGAGAASGMNWKTDEADGPKITLGDTPSAQDDARAWQVVKSLADAINNEDWKAFLGLFAKPDQSTESMFRFMAAQVLPTRGGIRSFHELSPPLIMSDSKFPVRAVTFHLENGYPGYFGIALDADGKIDHFSLFVKPDLCPNGPDTQCDKIVKTLGEDFKL